MILADGLVSEQSYSLLVQDGIAHLETGLPKEAVLTIKVQAGTWAAILLKKKRIETVFLQGKIKVEGRLEEALPLRSAFGI